MSDLLKPGLGTFIAYAPTTPPTDDIAGYEDVSVVFVTIGEVTEVPEFGPEHAVVEHTPLATGTTAKYHGAKNNGSLNIPMALDSSDNGQIALKTALDAKSRGSFRVTYADDTIDYFQGKVFSFRRGASISDVVMATVAVEIETDIVEDTSALA